MYSVYGNVPGLKFSVAKYMDWESTTKSGKVLYGRIFVHV